MQLCVSTHVQFVDEGVIPRHSMTAGLPSPIKLGIHDDAFRHERCTVTLVEGEVIH
jgi:hypothetical protein